MLVNASTAACILILVLVLLLHLHVLVLSLSCFYRVPVTSACLDTRDGAYHA